MAVNLIGFMNPEEKFEILRHMLTRGAEVYTVYRKRRVLEIWLEGRSVRIRYADGTEDKFHINELRTRRFLIKL